MAWKPGIFPCYYKHDPPATFIGESFFREKVVCNRMLLFFVFYHFDKMRLFFRCLISNGTGFVTPSWLPCANT